jgi:hypothetical protein
MFYICCYKYVKIMIRKLKKGDYNYEKWVAVVDFVGVTDQDKRDWLINYLQQLEDNANFQIPTKFNGDESET